jgi:hypothetical protein
MWWCGGVIVDGVVCCRPQVTVQYGRMMIAKGDECWVVKFNEVPSRTEVLHPPAALQCVAYCINLCFWLRCHG